MDLSDLKTGHRIIVGAGILLVIDLVFLPWHDAENLIGGSRTGIESPFAVLGVLALFGAIAMVAQIILDRLTTVELPDIGTTSWERVHLVAGIVVGALLLLKLILEPNLLAYGAWLGLLLGIAVAAGGFLLHREAMEQTTV